MKLGTIDTVYNTNIAQLQELGSCIIHAKTPKFESFFGDDKKNKLDFDMWERQVLSAATTHSGTAVKQAIMQSLKGQALMVISALPPETSWDKLLQALKIKYQDKASYDVLMAQFYGTKIEPDEKCASFGTRLEQKLNQVSLQYPNKISESMYWNCVRERFFHGLSKDMRTNLRTQFDSGANYYRLLELARIVESESLHEDSKVEVKTTSTKGKGKVSVATVDSTSQQIQQLQGAVKGLTKMLQGNQQLSQTTPQYVSQPAQSTLTELVQNDMNTLPQASPSQNPASFVNTQGVRGGRNGYRGRGRGSPILCYWCRDFLPKEQASDKVAQCPYQKQSNCTNPDPWARIVGSRNTAAIYMNGVATTALFDTGAEIQLVSKQFCEDNEWEIQPIENLTECYTMNGEIFGYEGFVEVNVQIPGRDFSEDHLFLVTSEISHQKEIPVVLGTYFIDSLSKYLHGIDKDEFDSLDYTVKQAFMGRGNQN